MKLRNIKCDTCSLLTLFEGRRPSDKFVVLALPSCRLICFSLSLVGHEQDTHVTVLQICNHNTYLHIFMK